MSAFTPRNSIGIMLLICKINFSNFTSYRDVLGSMLCITGASEHHRYSRLRLRSSALGKYFKVYYIHRGRVLLSHSARVRSLGDPPVAPHPLSQAGAHHRENLQYLVSSLQHNDHAIPRPRLGQHHQLDGPTTAAGTSAYYTASSTTLCRSGWSSLPWRRSRRSWYRQSTRSSGT
jgi:hypothetical protein